MLGKVRVCRVLRLTERSSLANGQQSSLAHEQNLGHGFR